MLGLCCCMGFSLVGVWGLLTWDPPGPGIEPMSPALAGGFFTTEPPWKPSWSLFIPPPHDPSSILNPQALASYLPSLDPHRSLPRPPLTRFNTRDLLPAPPCQHLTRCLSRGFIADSCPLQVASVKVLYSICQQIWKTQQWPQDWKRSVFISVLKKCNAKDVQTTAQLH